MPVDQPQTGSEDTARRLFTRLSETLLASTDARVVLQRMAEVAVPALGDWCAIDMRRDDGTFARLAVAHPEPAPVPGSPASRPCP